MAGDELKETTLVNIGDGTAMLISHTSLTCFSCIDPEIFMNGSKRSRNLSKGKLAGFSCSISRKEEVSG